MAVSSAYIDFLKNYDQITEGAEPVAELIAEDAVDWAAVAPLAPAVSTITCRLEMSAEFDVARVEEYLLTHADELRACPELPMVEFRSHKEKRQQNELKGNGRPKRGFYEFAKIVFQVPGTVTSKKRERRIGVKLFRHMLHVVGLTSDRERDAIAAKCLGWIRSAGAETGGAVEVSARHYDMINATCNVGFPIHRPRLSRLLSGKYAAVYHHYDPNIYPMVSIKLLWNEHKDGQCHCAASPTAQCTLSMPSKRRVCTKVSVAVGGTGKFNISGARTWEDVAGVAAWMQRLLLSHRTFLSA